MARKAPGRTPIRMPEEHEKCTDQPKGCEIQDLFKLLGKSHTLDILHLFVVQDHDRTLRFVEVQHALKLSPNTLSERLKELVEAGLLLREARNEIPPRVDYMATRKARDLEPVFEELIAWAKRHDLTAEPPAQPAAQATG